MIRDYYNKAHLNDLQSKGNRSNLPLSNQPLGLLSLEPLLTKACQIPGLLQLNPLRALHVLEIGTGTNPSFELVQKNLQENIAYSGMDFSAAAIDFCQQNFAASKRQFVTAAADEDWKQQGALRSQESFDPKFDIILDAHLLHCLTDEENRQLYLANVVAHLKVNGIFLLETCIASKKTAHAFDPELAPKERLNEGVYQQEIGDAWITTRRLKSALEIEAELIAAGLRLVFFQIPWGLRLQLNPQRAIAPFDPEVVHVIAQKNPD
jgi:2-polyprenyl-3-methyl-5-hydroxy-6-metoxy-1,4-benzoquinol methylase